MNKRERAIPELDYLLEQVEKRYGRGIHTTKDFESLSVIIERDTNELISSSTLKRMWGYVTLKPIPRISTLDILSRFIGHRDFRQFCETVQHSPAFCSGFLTETSFDTRRIPAGKKLAVGWKPDRLVTLEAMGEGRFRVTESLHSHLKPGDEFNLGILAPGYPMFIGSILRDGEHTPPYLAGRDGGITTLREL